MAITPDGAYVYVTNEFGGNKVSVINTSSNTVVATVSVGNNPMDVAVTPDGAYAYVANSGDGTVSVIRHGYLCGGCDDTRWKLSYWCGCNA